MATIEKYKDSAARSIIGHVERTLNYDRMMNQDIDFSRTKDDYSIGIEREDPYSHYQTLKDACYIYGRDDVKTLVGMIITLPHDVEPKDEKLFFGGVYDFLKEKYFPEVSIISSKVHVDEDRPHLHILACPITANTDKKGNSRYKELTPSVPDTRREVEKYKYKISASDVLTRRDYLTLHDSLQRYLKKHNIPGTVMSGITKAQGGNMRVREMKRESSIERAERETRINENLYPRDRFTYDRNTDIDIGRF